MADIFERNEQGSVQNTVEKTKEDIDIKEENSDESIVRSGKNYTEVKTEEKPADIPNENIPDNPEGNENRVFLRGVIRGIRQEIDAEERQQNIIELTTPVRNRGNDEPATMSIVKVVLGRNERAREMLAQLNTLDHVVINAQHKTYYNRNDRLSEQILYAESVEKQDPHGISGFGGYDQDVNEGWFIGTIRNVSEYKNGTGRISKVLIQLKVITPNAESTSDENRTTSTTLIIGVYGGCIRVYLRNRDRFAKGSRIGIAAQFSIGYSNKNKREEMFWEAIGFKYYDENGELVPIAIPTRYTYRAPRNTGDRQRRNQVVSTSTEEELKHIVKGQEEKDGEVAVSKPAAESVSSEKTEDMIRFEVKDGKTEANVEINHASLAEIRERIQYQIRETISERKTD